METTSGITMGFSHAGGEHAAGASAGVQLAENSLAEASRSTSTAKGMQPAENSLAKTSRSTSLFAGKLAAIVSLLPLPISIYLGLGGVLYSMFGLTALPVNMLMLAIIGVVACITFCVFFTTEKSGFTIAAVMLSVLIIYGIVFYKPLSSAWFLLINQVMDTLCVRYGRIFPEFAIAASEGIYAFYTALLMIPMSLLLSIAAGRIARSGSKIFMTVVPLFITAGIISGVMDFNIWTLLLIMAAVLSGYRSYSVKHHADSGVNGGSGTSGGEHSIIGVSGESGASGSVRDDNRKAEVGGVRRMNQGEQRSGQPDNHKVSGVASVFLTVTLFAALIALPLSMTKLHDRISPALLKEAVIGAAEFIRYGASDSNLPEGDFRGLGSFSSGTQPALKVTMSKPDSYYLRGYVGETYTGSGWTSLKPAERADNAEVFFWLHRYSFYGQTQISTLARLVEPSGTVGLAEPLGTTGLAGSRVTDKAVSSGESGEPTGDDRVLAQGESNEITDSAELSSNSSNGIDESVMTISNIGASPKYIYAPYELLPNNKNNNSTYYSQPDENMIGDYTIKASGFSGARDYSYAVLPNQVKRYDALSIRLFETQAQSEQILQYLDMEKSYREFVYCAYTAIPEQTVRVLETQLGVDNYAAGERMHYQEAKQRIFSYLSESITYTNTPPVIRANEDFAHALLERTRAGYSVHFATAAALMFRHFGIPARYVEGYLITPENAQTADDDGSVILTGENEHAWVEYYEDGIGWIPFEVAAPYSGVMDSADTVSFEKADMSDETGVENLESDSNEGSSSDSNQEEEKEKDEESEERIPPEPSGFSLPVISILLILAVLVLIILLTQQIIRRRIAIKKLRIGLDNSDPRTAICNILPYSMKLLHLSGLARRSGSLENLTADMPELFNADTCSAFADCIAIHREAQFSNHEMPRESAEALRSFMRRALTELKSHRNLFQRFKLHWIYFVY